MPRETSLTPLDITFTINGVKAYAPSNLPERAYECFRHELAERDYNLHEILPDLLHYQTTVGLATAHERFKLDIESLSVAYACSLNVELINAIICAKHATLLSLGLLHVPGLNFSIVEVAGPEASMQTFNETG